MKQSFLKLLAKIFIPNKNLRTKIKNRINFSYLYPIKTYPLLLKRTLGIDYSFNKEKHSEKVVYTVITNRYNNLAPLLFYQKDWDYICFTNDENLIKNGHKFWQIQPLNQFDLDSNKLSRLPKILAHKFLSEYKYSLYIDGNIDIISNELFDKADKLIKSETKLAITKHFKRNCIYDEFEACKKSKKDCIEKMSEQIQIFQKKGFPFHYGLKENSIILRQHNNKEIIKLMEQWWFWVEKFSKRDQLSLMFVLWENNYKNVPDIMNKPAKFCHNDLIFKGHNK